MSDNNINNEEKIYTGEISYTLLKLSGIWEPIDCTSMWKLIVYRFYTMCSLLSFFAFAFFLFIFMILEHDNIETLPLTVLYFCTIFAAFIKQIIIAKKRKIFIKTDEMFLSEMCRAYDNHESEILQNCSRAGRNISIYYLILVSTTAIMAMSLPLASLPNKILPIKYWFPFSMESKIVYSIAYFHQVFGLNMIIFVCVGTDALALTVMLRICAQLEIIIYRLDLISHNGKINKFISINYNKEVEIINCLKHHRHVYSIGQNVNRQFGTVIFVQFFVSMIELCVIIYYLSKININNGDSWLMISALSSYTFQIFMYCFYADKVTEKSLDIGLAVYSINWDALTMNTKKSLVTIMMQTTRPIKLTAASVIVMSLETFMKIIKSAYSAFNLLKNS